MKKLVDEGLLSIIFDNDQPPQSIEEVAKLFEKACDSLIHDAQNKESLTYIAGKFHIFATDDNKSFHCLTELYFKDKSGKWVTKKASSESFSQHEKLNQEAQDELKKYRKISLEITSP